MMSSKCVTAQFHILYINNNIILSPSKMCMIPPYHLTLFPADPDGGPGMLLDVERSEGNKFLSVQYAKVCTPCLLNQNWQ